MVNHLETLMFLHSVVHCFVSVSAFCPCHGEVSLEVISGVWSFHSQVAGAMQRPGAWPMLYRLQSYKGVLPLYVSGRDFVLLMLSSRGGQPRVGTATVQASGKEMWRVASVCAIVYRIFISRHSVLCGASRVKLG